MNYSRWNISKDIYEHMSSLDYRNKVHAWKIQQYLLSKILFYIIFNNHAQIAWRYSMGTYQK